MKPEIHQDIVTVLQNLLAETHNISKKNKLILIKKLINKFITKNHLEPLKVVLNFVKDSNSQDKMELINKDIITILADKGNVECLRAVLNFLSDVPHKIKLPLIDKDSIIFPAQNGNKECLKLILDFVRDLPYSEKLALVNVESIVIPAENNQSQCLELILDLVKDFPLKKKSKLVDVESIDNPAEKGYIDCLKLVLDFVKDFPLEKKFALVDAESIANPATKGHIDSLKLVLDFVKDFPLEQKFALVEKYSIVLPAGNNQSQCLELILDFVKDFPLEKKFALVDVESIANPATKGHIDCFKLVLDFVKDFPLEKKFALVDAESIGNIAAKCHIDSLKLVLDFVKDFPLEQKSRLVDKEVIRTSCECRVEYLSFLAKNNIREIDEKSIWDYFEKDNLEAKSQELWELTKTWENMDKVNDRLLANKELGVKFFADIVCFMVQNYKEPNREIILDDRKKIFDDIHNLCYDQKTGYNFEVFTKIVSLNIGDGIEKLKIAINLCIAGKNKVGEVVSEVVDTELLLRTLNFLAQKNIMAIGQMPIWDYVNKHNLEAKSQELWELSKNWENIDEVNNRLLANKELGVKFFADIICFMIQNSKELDRNIIPDDRKEIFNDILKLYCGEKDRYHYKFLERIALLKNADNIAKVKIATDLLATTSEMREKLLVLMKNPNPPANFNKVMKQVVMSKFLPIDKNFLIEEILPIPATEQKENSHPLEPLEQTQKACGVPSSSGTMDYLELVIYDGKHQVGDAHPDIQDIGVVNYCVWSEGIVSCIANQL